MANKVFEGSAELDIQKFLDGLKDMETAAGISAVKIAATFQALDQGIAQALGGFQNHLNAVAGQISGIGAALAGANAQMKQGQQQLAQQGQQANQQAQAQRQQQLAGHAAHLQALGVGYQRELTLLRQKLADEERAVRENTARIVAEVRAKGAAEAQQVQENFSRQAKVLRQEIETQRQLQARMLAEAERFKQDQAQLLATGFGPAAQVKEEQYQRAVAAARQAAETEASLQRRLTSVMNGELQSQTQAVRRAAKEREGILADERRNFVHGWRSALQQAVDDAAVQIKVVEDKWNSIFRAGSQISSVGTQLTNFAEQLGRTSLALTENAGDFDFWARRALAAARAANGALTNEFGQPLNTVERYREEILALGRDLGTLTPEQMAESWFTYQAALGTTIDTEQKLIDARNGLSTILQAAIVTDTNYATAIKGVAQVLGEFQLGADKAAEVTHILTSVTQRSQAEFSDVLEGFKMVGPIMAEMGVGVADTATMFTVLSEAGLKGSMAGRGLQMMMSRLLDTTGPANKALKEVFDASGQLANGWRDVVFEGGKFIGFLDRLNEQGEVVQAGFFRKFAEATKDMSAEQRASVLAEIFPENAFRNILPLIRQYVDEIAAADGALEGNTSKVAQLQREFNDALKQATLFNEQWELVSESVKVRMGQAMYGIKESLVRLGFAVAEAFIPVVEWVNRALQAFIAWAQQHPNTVAALIELVKWVGIAAAVFGPLLLAVGTALKAFATYKLIIETLTQSQHVLAVALRGIGVSLVGLSGPILAVIAVLGLLYLAWQNNFLGMGDTLGKFFGDIGNMFSALGDLLEGIFALISAMLSGNTEAVQAAVQAIAIAFIEAFLVLPAQLADALREVGNTLIGWAGDTFGPLAESLVIWGYNLMIGLVDGIYEGAEAVWAAAGAVAEGIAQYFRSYSPPRYGPLMGIYQWGKNLIGTFVEGMNSADLDAVEEIAGRIGDALQVNIKFSGGNAAEYAETMELANQRVGEMIAIVKEGGQVNEAFFADLQLGLGQWYEEVVSIALAYQQVYGLENQLRLEQEKLEVIRAQRKELDAQNKARLDAFDAVLGASDAANPLNATAQAAMVDPTTEEGKAKIEEMRRKLSREDFQNWINFQRRLWEQQHKVQDDALGVQEDAQDVAVEALTKQLDLAKEQYDYFVKMYEYAVRMLELQEEEDRLKKEKEEKGRAGATYGTPEQLGAYRDEIAGVVGADTALRDEVSLRDGGDDVDALGNAGLQREAEANRLIELEKLNRKKRAEFETQLINATSDEERKRIKEQKDAWDAAYREEKARLQERLQFAKEVEEAAERNADLSMAERIGPKERQFQQDILGLLGEQGGALLDANALKEQGGSLDQASLLAQGQLRDEERKLSDLRTLNDQKKLDFEERLRQAKGDPEATRRIKEEQDAWEAAYKRALETQQARVEAARRAKQDIADQDRAEAAERRAAGGGGVPPMPDRDAQPAAPVRDQAQPQPTRNDPAAQTQPEKRESRLMAEDIFADLKRGIAFLRSESVTSGQKLHYLGEAVKQALGWKTWWDALAPEETRARVAATWQYIVNGVLKVVADFRLSAEALWGGIVAGWNEWLATLGRGWQAFTAPFLAVWNAFWGFLAKVFYFVVGAAYLVWLKFLADWNRFVAAITPLWQAFLIAFNFLWTQAKQQWDAFATAFGIAFNFLWTLAKQQWDTFSALFAVAWRVLWTVLQAGWTAFETALRVGWAALWTLLTTGWETFERILKVGWAALWVLLGTDWETFRSNFERLWSALWVVATLAWNRFWEPYQTAWETFISGLERMWSALQTGFNNIADAVGRITDLGRWLVGQSFDKGSSKKDGSHADGLAYVPKDGYLAELHRGERVLTAAEAALYNSVERYGLLGVLNTLASSATARVSQTTAQPRVVQQTVVKEGDRKEVNFNGDMYVDATNPDEGRALMSKLAFLGT